MSVWQFHDTPQWWQTFALLWRRRDALRTNAVICDKLDAIVAALTPLVSPTRFSLFQAMTDDVLQWLRDVRPWSEEYARVLTYVPLRMQVQPGVLAAYTAARKRMAGAFPEIVPALSVHVVDASSAPAMSARTAAAKVQALVRAKQAQKRAKVELEIAKDAKRALEQQREEERQLMIWPPITNASVEVFRANLDDMIREKDLAPLRDTLVRLHASYPGEQRSNLAAGACFLDSHVGATDLDMMRYIHANDAARVDLDALLHIAALAS